MSNPFPALIAYMAIVTVLRFPVPCLCIVGLLCLVGWLLTARELINCTKL